MSEYEFWNNDWMDVQRKYWENWSDFSRKAMGAAVPAPKNPWEQSMEHWWQAVSPAAPATAQDFMGKMMEQGKNFVRLAEQFTGGVGPQAAPGDWMDVFNRISKEMQKAFTLPGQTGSEDLHRMLGAWEMPFDNWQRMVSSLSPTPGDLLRNMPHGGPQAGLEQMLSAPGLGYTREEQGQQQKMVRLIVEYQQALQEYARFFSNVGVLSVERMRQFVQDIVSEGRTIDSARELYDDWITCCEEVYGEQVMTPEYAEIHGRMVNALMGVKQQMGAMVDENLGALNMPTRKELRTLQERMQENRREIKALRADLSALKARGETTVAASEAPAPKAAPRRKAAPRKKTTVKN